MSNPISRTSLTENKIQKKIFARLLEQEVCVDYTGNKNFERQLDILKQLIVQNGREDHAMFVATLNSMIDDPNKKHFRRWKFFRWLFSKKAAAESIEQEQKL